jgi:hypothetical protein
MGDYSSMYVEYSTTLASLVARIIQKPGFVSIHTTQYPYTELAQLLHLLWETQQEHRSQEAEHVG